MHEQNYSKRTVQTKAEDAVDSSNDKTVFSDRRKHVFPTCLLSDNRENVSQHRKLPDNRAAVQLAILDEYEPGKPASGSIQRVSVQGEKMTHAAVAAVIEAMNLTKGVKQKFVNAMVAAPDDFSSEESAREFILRKASELGPPVDHEAIKMRGDDTEAAAASIIGGEVNRGQGNKDVEWRLIGRTELERIKELMGYEPGKQSDIFTFSRDNWSAVRRNEKIREEFPEIDSVLSTPVDAYSNHSLALAGGPAKFDKEKTSLKKTAADRINQLIILSNLLGYTPVLVFSDAVTCAQCDLVANIFGISVYHLGDRK